MRFFCPARRSKQHETEPLSFSTADPLAPLVEQYFERFSTKMCCFDDLQPYLAVLTAAESASLRDKMLLITESTDELVSNCCSLPRVFL